MCDSFTGFPRARFRNERYRRLSHQGALGEEPRRRGDMVLVVFPLGNSIPSTKVLTFYRKAPFDIEAAWAHRQQAIIPLFVSRYA
jgi:hypothetical protein